MYLMLSLTGHPKTFLTSTRGPYGSIRPAPTLALLADKRAGAMPQVKLPYGIAR